MTLSPSSLAVQATNDGAAISYWADVATIVIAVAVLVLLVVAIVLAARIAGLLKEARISMRQSFGPVSDRARSISQNVEFITHAVRTDVEQLNDSVKGLTDRLQLASERMEERIEEFNALMEVVQGEAEEIFLDTASTVRGVREGARAITKGGDRPSRGTDAAGGERNDGPTDEDHAAPEAPLEENALAADEA